MKGMNRMTILAAAALLLAATLSCTRQQIRLVSYNVGAFGKELEDSAPMVARMMNELGAESIALAELDSCNTRHDINQAQHLADELNALASGGKARWSARFGRAMAYAGGAYGCGVATRLRILDSFRIPLPQEDGGEPRVCVVVETPRYVFASCHLDHRSERARLAQVRVLTEALKTRYGEGRKPVILAGDFNDYPDSQVIQELGQNWTRLSPLEPTFPATGARVCIDYFFLLQGRASVKVVGGFVPTDFASGDVTLASDHLPLVLDLVL